MGIEDYATTADGNKTVNPPAFPENMAASAVNDQIRVLMADIKNDYNDRYWQRLGADQGVPTITYVSGTSVTIAADVTTIFHKNRRARAIGTLTGTITGYVQVSTYSAPNTTITFVWDSGSLSNETLQIGLGPPIEDSPIPGFHGTFMPLAEDRRVGMQASSNTDGDLQFYQNNELAFDVKDNTIVARNSRKYLAGKNTTDDGATVGVELSGDGTVYATKSAGEPLVINRTDGDGRLIEFKVDGTTVGYLTHTSGTLAIEQA